MENIINNQTSTYTKAYRDKKKKHMVKTKFREVTLIYKHLGAVALNAMTFFCYKIKVFLNMKRKLRRYPSYLK